jgi:outer membrane protein assembly factor BamD
MVRNAIRNTALLAALMVLPGSCGRHRYDNPITKDTQQPDKVLFDKAIADIEHSRFETARFTLQTLINTYDTSEYLAKSKLAIADSWFREGGAHGLAQAEAEYKDFILFYPAMEEAAEAQEKVCDIHYKQMEKADRDPMHALRAEDECRQLLIQFPNSKFAPEAQQKLRGIQEVLAESEFRTAAFYHTKGSFPASANRFQSLSDQFPLYSQADEALWQLADSYQHMGDRFENQQVAAYTRIVKDYPLSVHADAARAKLKEMNRPVPEADPVALARMKYELENHTKMNLMGHFLGAFRTSPTMNMAAKSGSPQMTGLRPTIPVSVPLPAGGTEGVSSEVSVSTVADSSAIDRNPDARTTPAAPGGAAGDSANTVTATQPGPGGTPAPPPPAPVQQSTVTRTGLDVNTASLAELQKLPGVNKLQAQRIFAMRPFLSIQDLIRTGLPQKAINNLKPAAKDSATPAPAKK